MPQYTLRRLDERDKNGVYYIFWSENRRSKRISTRERDLSAAQAFFAQWLLMEREGAGASTLTVTDLWKVYFEKHGAGTGNPTSLANAWKNLSAFFGGRLVAEVTPALVDEYVAKRTSGRLGRKVKESSVRQELSVLRACFNWCAHSGRGLLRPAEVPRFDLPKASPPRDRWLTTDEIRRLFDAAAKMRKGSRLSRLERFLWLALETGARKNAILGLTWDRVDFDTGVIHYHRPGDRVTKKRKPSVPISAALEPVLRRMHAERRRPNDPNEPVVGGSDVWRALVAAAAKAGVPGVSPHVLRHTAATHMARRGVPLWKIAKVLGNTTAMVEQVYAKHCPDDLREAVNTISGGFLEAAE